MFVLIALLAGAVVVTPVRAQEQQHAVQINQIDASAYPTIRAVVSVSGADGDPAPQMTAASFQAFEGDAPIPLASVQPASDPQMRLAVAIAIDTSESMAGAPLDAAKEAATSFVQGLRPVDEASIFTFGDSVTQVAAFTADKAALTVSIAGLDAGDSSALYEATQTSAFAASATTAPRQAVVLLTDGTDDARSSDVDADGALSAAESIGVPVYTIALGVAADEGFLQSLAADTHGAHRAVAVGDAGDALASIAAVLRSQYVLTMTGALEADAGPGELRLIADIEGSAAGAVAPFQRGIDPDALDAFLPDEGGGVPRYLVVVAVAVAVIAVAGAASYWGRRFQLERELSALAARNRERAAAQGVPGRTPLLRASTLQAGAASPSMGTGGAVLVAAQADGPETVVAMPNAPDVAPSPAPGPERASPPIATPIERPARLPAPAPPPPIAGSPVAANASAAPIVSAGVGRFIERTEAGERGREFELGVGPIAIGSSARECVIVLPSADVAPVHARVLFRDGKYVITHVGGLRRATLVDGNVIERVALEHGDEVQIGEHRLVYEEIGNERPLLF